MLRRWQRIAVLIGFAAVPGFALDPARVPTQYRLDVWTQDQGLPQNSINVVMQSRDGYLWLGTEEGLVRFDGARFTVYDRGSAPELASGFVAALAEDRDGSLWIGTYGGGVARLDRRGADPGHIALLPLRGEGLVADRVAALLVDRAGDLVIGSAGGGMLRWRGDHDSLVGSFEVYTTRQGLGGDRISEIVEDDLGLWIAAYGGGLVRLRDGVAAPVALDPHPAAQLLRSIYRDHSGQLWVATDGAGLFMVDGEQVVRYTEGDGLSSDRVRVVLEDRDGNVWVGTDRGLDRLRDGQFANLDQRHGLPGEGVRSLAEDREGSLWVGTTGGLVRLRDSKLLPFTLRDGLPARGVRPLLETADGALWVGTVGGGLARIVGQRVDTWTARDGLPGDEVFALALGTDGSILVGADRGLARLTPGPVGATGAGVATATSAGLGRPPHQVTASVAHPTGRIRTVLEDRTGRVWVGTTVGLFWLAGDLLVPAQLPGPPLPDNPVRALLEDRGGRLHVGFDGGGLVSIGRDGHWQQLTRREGLGSDRVFTLHQDAEATLWIGTSGGGLSRLGNAAITTFTRSDGLFDDVIFRILEDDDGGLWTSSNRGIARVAKADLERFAAGKLTRIPHVAYGAADGMPSAECNGGSPAGARTRDGRLWFPTTRGLVAVAPRAISRNPLPPPVVIETVAADGKPAVGPGMALGPGVLRLEIHYTALSLVAPERVRFRYRLEGLDPDWVEADNRRVAYYTGVPAGSYHFRVNAANDDGVWNEVGAGVAVVVAPHWHETIAFRGAAAFGLVALLTLGYRHRVRALTRRQVELQALVDERTGRLREERAEAEHQRQEAERQRERAEQASRAKSAFVAGMSHELRTPLHAMLGFAQLMERRPGRDGEDSQHLATINRSGEHLLGLINGVLSLSQIEAGRASLDETPFDLAGLLRGLGEMFEPRARGRGLALHLELAATLPAAVVGDEGKLRQIVINLLGNACKFTERGSVTLRANYVTGKLVIEVEDTGPGLSMAEQEGLFAAFAQAEAGRRAHEGSGLGLALSRDFARLMSGDLTVESAPGRGCRFHLEIPVTVYEGTLPPRTTRLQRVTPLEPGQQLSVLVADSSHEERHLLGRLLGEVGYRVWAVASGDEALEVWQEHHPEVMVHDLHLAGLAGLEVVRLLRAAEAAEPRRPTVVVCISASTLEGERERALAAGCDAFLAKPFRDSTLLGKLAELLGVRHVAAAPAASDVLAGPTGPPNNPAALVAGLRRCDSAWRGRLRAALAGGENEVLRALAADIATAAPELGASLEVLIGGYHFDQLESCLAAAEEAT